MVTLTQVREIVIPTAARLRDEIERRNDIPAAREVCRQLEAFRKYLQDREGRDLLAAECRRTEVLIGKLLGPGEIGINQYSEGSPVGESFSDVPKDDRHKFRLMAANEHVVEKLLKEGKVSRNVILDKIQRRISPATQTCTVDDLQKLIEQRQRFGSIYVDPPWSYGNQATRSATDNHYETMTVEEIAALPLPELAADECHLHLWTTNAFLHDSFHLLEGWGFEFKSLLVWDKDKFGIGNYWRLQTEYLLLGIKGDLRFLDHSQPNLVRGARGKHSAKPERVRKMIEKVSPGPRLEMFARRISNGWVAWGNEIERTMFDGDVKEVE